MGGISTYFCLGKMLVTSVILICALTAASGYPSRKYLTPRENAGLHRMEGYAKKIPILKRNVQKRDITETQKTELLNAHNTARSVVQPPATSMVKMKWSEELAVLAQGYADQCQFQHSDQPTRKTLSFNSIGENIGVHFSTASVDDFDLATEFVYSIDLETESWDNEKQYYDLTTMACSQRPCGHYTQVVWSDSEFVGCGAAYNCDPQSMGLDDVDPRFTNAVILFCNYAPAGNDGGRPYISGTSCSNCPADKPSCENNLCVEQANPVQCSVDPPIPTNAMISLRSGTNNEDDTVTFACDAGFSLDDDTLKTVRCQSDGQWSTGPTCSPNPVQCSVDPPIPTNAMISSRSGTNNEDDTVTFACDAGFSFDDDTLKTVRCQSDGQWSTGPTCSPNPVQCSVDPPIPTNAMISSRSGTNNEDDTVTFACDAGFSLDDDTLKTVRCQSDGQWSTGPTCLPNPVQCSVDPPIPTNAMISSRSGTNNEDDTVTFACDAGFSFDDDTLKTVRCQSDGQWSTGPTCLPNPVQCSVDPPIPTNAMISSRSGTNNEDDTVTFACDAGFSFDDDTLKTVRCQSDGQWSTGPTCLPNPVQCSVDPPIPTNAMISSRSGTNNEDDTVTFACDAGFSFNDDTLKTVRCQSDGQWSTGPTCSPNPVQCSVDPPIPTNAMISSRSGTNNEDDTVTFACDAGFSLDDDTLKTVICQSDGQWSTGPTCLPNPVQCSVDPPIPTNAMIASRSGTNNEDDTVTFACDAGFSLDDDTLKTVICQSDGQWSTGPTCSPNPVQCSVDPPIPTNAMISSRSGTNNEDDTVTFACDAGFSLDDDTLKTVRCQSDGQWSTGPTCSPNPVQCSVDPPIPTNAMISSRSGTNNEDDTVTFACDAGFSFNDDTLKTVRCQSDGQWSTGPTCSPNPVQCSVDPPIPTNAMISSRSGTNNEDDTVTFACDAGFSLDDDTLKTVICQSDGQWSTGPTCLPNPVQCSVDPPIPTNAMISSRSGTNNEDDTVTFACDAGFSLDDDTLKTVRCQSDGQWSTGPTCSPNPVQCSVDPPIPTNAMISSRSGTNNEDDTVTFACDAGFSFDDDTLKTVRCQSDGQWSTGPTCSPSDALACTFEENESDCFLEDCNYRRAVEWRSRNDMNFRLSCSAGEDCRFLYTRDIPYRSYGCLRGPNLPEGRICVSLDYYVNNIYRWGRGSLEINLYDDANDLRDVFFVDRNLGDKWNSAVFETESKSGDSLLIRAYRGWGRVIGVDNVKVTEGPCGCDSIPCKNGGTCQVDGTCNCPPGLAAPTCSSWDEEFICGFETDFCGLQQVSEDADWIRKSGSTPTGNTGPISATEGNHYAYVEATGLRTGNRASLQTPYVFSDGHWCIQLKYHMYGYNVFLFKICTVDENGSSEVIAYRFWNRGDQWHDLNVDANLGGKKLRFDAYRGLHFLGDRGDIAIDNIRITPGACPEN